MEIVPGEAENLQDEQESLRYVMDNFQDGLASLQSEVILPDDLESLPDEVESIPERFYTLHTC